VFTEFFHYHITEEMWITAQCEKTKGKFDFQWEVPPKKSPQDNVLSS